MPSGEVTMAPASPTATNCVPDHATPRKKLVVGEARNVTGTGGTVIRTKLNPPTVNTDPSAAPVIGTPELAIPTTNRRFPPVTLSGVSGKEVVPVGNSWRKLSSGQISPPLGSAACQERRAYEALVVGKPLDHVTVFVT